MVLHRLRTRGKRMWVNWRRCLVQRLWRTRRKTSQSFLATKPINPIIKLKTHTQNNSKWRTSTIASFRISSSKFNKSSSSKNNNNNSRRKWIKNQSKRRNSLQRLSPNRISLSITNLKANKWHHLKKRKWIPSNLPNKKGKKKKPKKPKRNAKAVWTKRKNWILSRKPRRKSKRRRRRRLPKSPCSLLQKRSSIRLSKRCRRSKRRSRPGGMLCPRSRYRACQSSNKTSPSTRQKKRKKNNKRNRRQNKKAKTTMISRTLLLP